MTVNLTGQPLQLIILALAMIEFILALYVLVLNAWHTANRHVGSLLLLYALNSFAWGLMAGATTAAQGRLPSIIQAATITALQPAALVTAVALLKPDWLRGRRRWVWWPVYGLVALPVVLTLLDLRLGTGLYYTGLGEDYCGGFVPLAAYACGPLGIPVRLSLYVTIVPTIISLLYIALTEKKATPNRRLAWLLLALQVVTILMQGVFMALTDPLVATLITNTAFAAGYVAIVFRQTMSGQHRQRGRLPVRLTITILVIAIPLFVSVMALFVNLARAEMENSIAGRLEATNRSLEANTGVWLSMNVRALQQLASLPGIAGMDASQQKPVLETVAATHPHMYLVSTLDLDGLNVARSDDQAPRDYGGQRWFREARDGSPVVFQSVTGHTSGEPALVISVPIRDAADQIVGVAMFASDLTTLAQEIAATSVGEVGVAYVVDDEDHVIAHPDPAFSQELVDYSDYPPVATLRSGTEGATRFTDAFGRQWRAHTRSIENDWAIIVQQQERELMAPLRGFRIGVWSMATLSVIVLGILTSLAIHQALLPARALTQTATAIAAGDLERTAPVESEDEFGALARAVNSMTARLRELINSLEQRVTDRTRDVERRSRYLQATADVARDAAALLDQQELLDRVTTLISERFRFYHTGIFLLDSTGEWAELRAASSEGGRRMLARGHRLRVGGKSIVGYAIDRGEPRVALDVGEDAVYFDNPDLPETRSEAALPLQARGDVIGALDVQSTEQTAFSEEDVAVLQALADQVALAISNARLFEQVQESIEASRYAYGEASRQDWQALLSSRSNWGFRYAGRVVLPAEGDWRSDMVEAMQVGQSVQHDDPAGPAVSIPLKVRDQVIGALRFRKGTSDETWTAEGIALLEALVEQLGPALESARLYEDTQRRAAREQVSSEIASRVRETLDMETVLKTAVQEIREALGLPEVVIRLAAQQRNDDGNGAA